MIWHNNLNIFKKDNRVKDNNSTQNLKFKTKWEKAKAKAKLES
jgi:hypothetical protein